MYTLSRLIPTIRRTTARSDGKQPLIALACAVSHNSSDETHFLGSTASFYAQNIGLGASKVHSAQFTVVTMVVVQIEGGRIRCPRRRPMTLQLLPPLQPLAPLQGSPWPPSPTVTIYLALWRPVFSNEFWPFPWFAEVIALRYIGTTPRIAPTKRLEQLPNNPPIDFACESMSI